MEWVTLWGIQSIICNIFLWWHRTARLIMVIILKCIEISNPVMYQEVLYKCVCVCMCICVYICVYVCVCLKYTPDQTFWKSHLVVFSWQMGQSEGFTHMSGTMARWTGRLISAGTVHQNTYTRPLRMAVSGWSDCLRRFRARYPKTILPEIQAKVTGLITWAGQLLNVMSTAFYSSWKSLRPAQIQRSGIRFHPWMGGLAKKLYPPLIYHTRIGEWYWNWRSINTWNLT